MLGKGTFGQVHLVRKLTGHDKGRLYALKCIKKTNLTDKLHMESSSVEMNILSKLDDPMLVHMHYAFQSSDTLYMALDYCPGGELFFYLQQIGKFREQAAKFYAANVLMALCSLHSIGVLYRDLKPENILVNKDGYLKLTDFGLSKILNKDEEETEDKNRILGTPEYMAPEVLSGKGYSLSSEWWAFGCLLYEFLVGIPPFFTNQNVTSQPQNRLELYRLIKSCSPKLDYKHLTPNARDLLSKLLTKDPSQRLGTENIQQIMDHPWFSDIEWELIRNKTHKCPYVPELDSETDTKYFSQEFTQMVMPSADLESQDSEMSSLEESPINWLFPCCEKEATL